ncbi:translational activator of cytochrome c oxidase 1-like, partial [Terrapene carolina triunguis]|uniref:translational activator of cytochrome c oxidase 1-like n=1 Tax=Terrapene triunguis TaxID=2587831 RepID=UPI001156C2FD
EFTPMSLPSTMGRASAPYRCCVLALVLTPRLATPGHRPSGHTLHTTDATYAGHKWSKVKYIKGLPDAQRSRFFQKFTLLCFVVKATEGPNPDLNTNQASIIEQCRSKSMPKASTEVAIKGG